MTDVSVIIPARNEEFLIETIDSVLQAKEADTEIIVLTDGYTVDIPANDAITVINNKEAIGQRQCVNLGAKLSRSKYIMKLDAHCSVGPGFDRILMEHCKYDYTLIPRMYNLHAFDWVCDCEKPDRIYQGPTPQPCGKCKQNYHKEIKWHAKPNPETDAMLFDKGMKFGYWRAFKNRPEAKGDLVPSLGALGACFFMEKDRFWELGGLDEGHGGWGQFGTEMSCKAWLSGGQQLICTKTWFAHMFRTGHGFGFPYKITGRQTRHARRHSQDLWLNDKWPGAKHSLRWLIDKFAPVPTWDDEAIARINAAEVESKPVIDQIKRGLAQADNTLKKGIIYYTDNRLEERIAKVCRAKLLEASEGKRIISVSLMPIDFPNNIVLDETRGILTMFKQILKGLEKVGSDVVFFCEHDVLYHPSHFETNDVIYHDGLFQYNQNNWKLDTATGQALFYYCKQTLGVSALTNTALAHYRKRVQRVEKEGFNRRMGYEPGTHKAPRGFDQTNSEVYFSRFPNIDIRHGFNLTGKRFKKSQYRSQRSIKGWTLADEIPYWGKTIKRFDEFLEYHAKNNF
jgi:glycosyltransferase involved in cell wall biosynthesis